MNVYLMCIRSATDEHCGAKTASFIWEFNGRLMEGTRSKVDCYIQDSELAGLTSSPSSSLPCHITLHIFIITLFVSVRNVSF